MPYEPFYERFRDLALLETRSFTVDDGNYPGLPADESPYWKPIVMMRIVIVGEFSSMLLPEKRRKLWRWLHMDGKTKRFIGSGMVEKMTILRAWL
jgi:hypothetical protein